MDYGVPIDNADRQIEQLTMELANLKKLLKDICEKNESNGPSFYYDLARLYQAIQP